MMKSTNHRQLQFRFAALLLSLSVATLLLWCSWPSLHAQNAPATGPAAPSTTTNAPSTNAPDGSTNTPDGPAAEPKKLPTDLIDLSFQNMQIDQVIQWLSENTGKSVIKYPHRALSDNHCRHQEGHAAGSGHDGLSRAGHGRVHRH